jgi:acetyltransferase-like isoleucine patch superfamily enzyme
MRGAIGLFLRQRLYRGLFRECGRGVVIGHNVTIRNPCRICIGDNVVIDDNVVLDAKGDAEDTLSIASNSIIGRNSILVCKGGKIVIEPEVNISVNCTIISESEVTIGEKSLVGGHCYIIAGGNHGTQLDGTPFVDQPRLQKGGVTILHNCWLGANSTILDGTTIGPDAIVGAAALVRRDVPEKTIVAGVPAAIISSSTTDPPVISRLLS